GWLPCRPGPPHCPRQTGGRFSPKAAAPPLASADANTRPLIAFCRAHASSLGPSADSTMIRFFAIRAGGAFAGPRAAAGRRTPGPPPPAPPPVNRARRGRAARRAGPAGERDLHREVVGDPARQPEQAARAGDQPPLHLRETEHRLLTGDDQVARER